VCVCVCVCVCVYTTHFLLFLSSNYLSCHRFRSHLQDTFFLITTFVQLCSNYVCQRNIFYVLHLKFMLYIYTTYFLFFLSSNCLACHWFRSHLQDTFSLIITFAQLCLNDVCQWNIFYVLHLKFMICFHIFSYCVFLFSCENVKLSI